VVAAVHEVAVRAAVAQLTAEDLDAMADANRRFARALRRSDAEAALAADDELHGIPVRAAGNDAVRAVLEQYTPLLRRVERLRFASLDARGSVRLHDRLIAACTARDADAAARASTLTWQTLVPLLDRATGGTL
jgi:DNA-binding GntR family transcriptional regulator